MIKRIIFIIVLLFSTPAFAESLQFSWAYDEADQQQVTGFRLYRDGTTLEAVEIPATARTVIVPRQTDKRSHTYHLTAYSEDDESKPSATAIDAYIAAKVEPVTGALTIKVVP